ncbi:tRNA pseudouridine(55) synthase TruB [Bifidobacterium sp.]|jgi:tRNA pseudouridine55 synthase|uniref:tRNA pseudouridine(55) synthase TruB n=1 Tax=Bifidobacterium sp. TaxID=41200 RepID=UPI0025C5DBA7|nr:tRNA pseudouridine(55) synthase TruB [Bifidobacterium sp.]MCI1635322.1 tRNA pseudouridine(55) synthase TruB [Bifidobacterium sp.]
MESSGEPVGFQKEQSLKSGIFIADKPQGVTSHDVVAAFRGALHMKRVGHAGTLDPMATGVLIIGFGHATRLLNYISGHDKSYCATIRLGIATQTDDAEGEYIESDELYTGTVSPDLSLEYLNGLVQQHFVGDILQVPSSFSAVKVHGVKAYDLARAGKDVELKAREVTISSYMLSNLRTAEITLQDGSMRQVIDVDAEVSCSSGTYIRALARDLGTLLGIGGHLTRLRRNRIGAFDTADPQIAGRMKQLTSVERTFTNRSGESITKNRAVLQDPQHLWDGAFDEVSAAQLAMPCVEITAEQAQDCRFGRVIGIAIHATTAAIETLQDGQQRLCAILEPVSIKESHPIAVFPLAD